MKTLRVILLALALSSLAAPALPANAAPSDSSCGCTCCVLKERQSGTAPVGGSFSVSKIKACGGDKSADTPSVAADDETACISLCGEKEGEYGMRACVKGDCWCKQGENFSFIGQTGSAEQCVTACAEAKLEFGNWGAPPATKTSAVKCPPGGMWTKEECEAQVDTMGEKVGEWLPPSGSDTKGPYCYVLQKPVKLSVAVGGLTSANLAQYLSAAYRLGLGVAAVLAVIFIMIGGFRYITAAGGDGVGAAKTMIKDAVMGLLLTALSYTLLQTVNPDITGLRLPRVQIVKACNVGVSCAARSDKGSCEKNVAGSGMRCIWNINSSTCYENSANESGAVGMNGGECKNDGQNNFSCLDGSKCIAVAQYGSGSHVCSQGKACQACNTDNDCGSQSGAPGKCQDHVCVVQDPSGQPGTYLKCNNGSCKKNTDCDTGFCDIGSHTCKTAGQGKDCTVYGQDSCASGYKCIEFKAHSGSGFGTLKFCCLNGDMNGCRGCGTDASCPDEMICNISDKDPKTQYKCVIR